MVLKLCRFINNYFIAQICSYSTKAQAKKSVPIITCKQSTLDYFKGTTYKKFDNIPLASKGWNSRKSNGDFFVIHEDNINEHYQSQVASTFPTAIDSKIIQSLLKQNVTTPSWIQHEAADVLLSGKHSLLAAETGCGKTLAYLIPIAQQLLRWDKPHEMNTPHVLILVPNRELAQQIGKVAHELLNDLGLKSKVVFGGHTKRLMMNPTVEDVDLLIATPGALGKLATSRIYHLNDVRHVVVDEADTLMDDSFQERLASLMRRFPLAQTTLVSATAPKKYPVAFEHLVKDLVHVESPLLHKMLGNVKHRFLKLSRSAKPSQLLQLAKNSNAPMLVFTNKSVTCNWVSLFLNENGVKSLNLHGDMHTDMRRMQWQRYLNGVPVLVTTDVASRGLDTSDVKHVINYDFPLYAADYIHRCGRTGRLGSPDFCRVTNFVSGEFEVRLLQQIELSVRRGEPIPNVDGNISAIIRKKEIRKLNEL